MTRRKGEREEDEEQEGSSSILPDDVLTWKTELGTVELHPEKNDQVKIIITVHTGKLTQGERGIWDQEKTEIQHRVHLPLGQLFQEIDRRFDEGEIKPVTGKPLTAEGTLQG